MQRFHSFSEFWPFYVTEHSKKTTRILHFIGSLLVIILLLLGVFSDLRYWILIPFAGYGFAWVSHFTVEKNRPATFQYPLWSLMADYRMFWLMCIGRMDDEVRRYGNYS